MSADHPAKGRSRTVIWSAFILLSLLAGADAREINPKTEWLERSNSGPKTAASGPVVEYAVHKRGNIQLAVANNGTFGTYGRSIPDPLTGEGIPSCIFPKNSDLVYLWVAAIWAGAIKGNDTLVSVGDEDFYVTTEFWPDIKPFGDFRYESIDPNSRYYTPDAFSEEDIICEYTDTLNEVAATGVDATDGRPHKPLGIKVTQRSMAWSYSYAQDFILFDYRVKNIDVRTLSEVYLGIWLDGDVWHISNRDGAHWNDDMVGFLRTYPAPEGHGYLDTINVAYHTDNDGDPVDGTWDEKSVPHAVGVRVVRTPAEEPSYSFNWWIIDYSNPSKDFGPRRRGTPEDPFRSFGSRLGTPEGDKNKYYILSHPEFDYDQYYVAQNHMLKGWLPPPENAGDIADGYDCRYLLSFGPFEIHPGQELPISFAWLGGSFLHSDPTNFDRLYDERRPDIFYNSLDFSGLAANSRWASWVYDNPGIDTDKDGYFGKFRVYCTDSVVQEVDTIINGNDTTITVIEYTDCDTLFHEGDGVPDFRGAGPPPAPELHIIPDVGRLTIRFNGLFSETTRDIFSRVVDFEGYRVYFARDDRPSSFSVVASYDIEDYNKYVFVDGEYQLLDIPFTIDSLRCLYGDSCNDVSFHPLAYTRSFPYQLRGFPESTFVFTAQDYNVSELGVQTEIHKRFPNQPYPSSLIPDSARLDELTERGQFKYFEYEMVLESLLPTVPYFISVTAFDFGSPKAGLAALETSVVNNAQLAYALSSSDQVVADQLEAYVYPNPYRSDAGYVSRGLESRFDREEAPDRSHRIHFANLPARCIIKIYSLDGDLVRELVHDMDPDDPTSSHHEWNLITRNTQLAVTGLYYFVVESAQRTQIGKFAIIR